MRIKYVIKDIIFVTVIAMSFSLMAMTSFASPAPTTSAPTAAVPTPLYPSHINSSLSVYYLKFQHQVSWTSSTYLNYDGVVSASSGYATTDFISINPSVDRMICLRVSYNGTFTVMRNLCFYDSSLRFLYCYRESNYVISGLEIPSDAAYFRFSIASSASASSLSSNYRPVISPEIVPFNDNTHTFDDVFWRDYLSVQSYMIYPDGRVSFVCSSEYAFDELYAEFTLSTSYFNASYVSCTVSTKVRDGSYGGSYYPAEYTEHDYRGDPFRPSIEGWYFSSDYSIIRNGWEDGNSYDNPCTLLCHNNDNTLSGFTIRIPLNKPSGLLANSSVSVDVYNIFLDDYAVLFKELSINTSNSIDGGLAQAPLPSPSFDLNEYINDAFANVDTSWALTVFGWFWSVPFLVSMTSIVAVVALISYILFGKKG